jgi:hypothetical protein
VDLSKEPAPGADSEAEGVVTPPAAVRRRRSRRPLAMAVGVVVVAAVVVGLLAVLRSEGPGEGVRPTTTPGVGAAEPAAASEEPALDDAAGPGTVAATGDSASGAVTEPEMESLGDSLLGSISRYYGLTVALDDGRASCADLQAAYVEVDSRWMTYNIEGKARFQGRLPDDLATRDERLYAGVQDVEREFGQSGCERP